MKTSLKNFALFAVAASATFAAQANLVLNPSFEIISGLTSPISGTAGSSLDAGEWGVYTTIPNWTTVSGSGIELHRTPPSVVNPVLAPDGNVYVELDSHPGPSSNSAMAQSLTLAPGKYSLSFQYRPRTSSNTDNIIAASFNNVTLVTLQGPPPYDWATSVTTFEYAGGTAALKFAALGTENTLGGFIDDVVLVRVPDSGSMLAMFGVGLIGLGCFRRRLA
jgi:hypothetical protein